jgi:hypothetical protein
VTFRDAQGLSHSVDVTASSLFEAAATALAMFRAQEWIAPAITPGIVLRVEVLAPSIIHDVPLKAVESWMRSPATSPKDFLLKRPKRGGEP